MQKIKFPGQERWFIGLIHALLQKTIVMFPASALGGSQPPVSPSPRNLTPFSGF